MTFIKNTFINATFMQKTAIAAALSMAFIGQSFANGADNEGYYFSAKIAMAKQKASGMDNSLRPGIGSFVPGKDSQTLYSPSLAVGYRFANGWRTEGEYTFNKQAKYTSGSSIFKTSLNHHHTDTSRLMLNVYRDYRLTEMFSVYGSAGLGIARVSSYGWQGNASRVFAKNTDTNVAYSLGAGITFTPVNKLSFDLGYRFVDLGKTSSGLNLFRNNRGPLGSDGRPLGLQDEQLKAHLYSNEVYLGARYQF